jgi:molybdenum cofactor cytidylyltransferase
MRPSPRAGRAPAEDDAGGAPAERGGVREAGRVAGIVLAAGASTRMRRNKLLLPVEGEALVRRAVRRAAAAGLDPLLVVLGHEADAVARVIADLPCERIVNREFASGMATSLGAGIRSVPADAVAAVVVLADMPLVTPAMIAEVVARYRATGAPLVASDYGGVTAPPTLYDRRLFDELLHLAPEGCGKRVLRRHRAETEMISWPPPALIDLDRPEDYDHVARGTGPPESRNQESEVGSRG